MTKKATSRPQKTEISSVPPMFQIVYALPYFNVAHAIEQNTNNKVSVWFLGMHYIFLKYTLNEIHGILDTSVCQILKCKYSRHTHSSYIQTFIVVKSHRRTIIYLF